jgi:hypothetical protein
METCPAACRCQNTGDVMCWLKQPGCDLHSSDAYLIHRRAFKKYLAGGVLRTSARPTLLLHILLRILRASV